MGASCSHTASTPAATLFDTGKHSVFHSGLLRALPPFCCSTPMQCNNHLEDWPTLLDLAQLEVLAKMFTLKLNLNPGYRIPPETTFKSGSYFVTDNCRWPLSPKPGAYTATSSIKAGPSTEEPWLLQLPSSLFQSSPAIKRCSERGTPSNSLWQLRLAVVTECLVPWSPGT